MAKTRTALGLAGGCLLLWGTVTPAWAVTQVKDMLDPKLQPKQKGVVYSIPSPQDYDACRVMKIPGPQPNSVRGFALLDPKGKPICRFLDANGTGRVDFWSYYRDGVEIYREWDTKKRPKSEFPQPTNFRWLNGGGMKWGVDVDGDGKIDGWKMISAEEVAEEVFLAARDGDLHRLQALFISENEMQALRLPADMMNKIRGQIKDASRKFQITREKLPALTDKAQFVRVEGAPPQCRLAEEAKTDVDLFLFPARAVLFKGEDQKHDWLQAGEMIKVGLAWRLLDAPGYQDLNMPNAEPSGTNVFKNGDVDKETQALLQKLSDHDQQPNTPPTTSGPDAKMVAYNLDRVAIVEQILARKPAAERETWVKQIFDNLSTAAQYSDEKDTRAITRLIQLRDQACKDHPGTNLAAYGTFRTLWAQYIPKIAAANGAEGNKLQKEWLEQLSKFVQTYSKSEDAADALFHLGMGCEAQGMDDEAKRWYQQMVNHFPEHILTPKAAGSKRRLELVGSQIELAGPTLAGGADFDITRLKGKLVVVYYWSSNTSNCVTDFPRLKQLHTMYNAKGLELVLVNLDDTAGAASRYLQSNPVPGTHLFQAAKEGGGFNSLLALQYGIQGLPTLFFVGRDGKVISRTLQITDLEEAIRKAP
jgi:thiol-disulfide isomerase/thioredoxin